MRPQPIASLLAVLCGASCAVHDLRSSASDTASAPVEQTASGLAATQWTDAQLFGFTSSVFPALAATAVVAERRASPDVRHLARRLGFNFREFARQSDSLVRLKGIRSNVDTDAEFIRELRSSGRALEQLKRSAFDARFLAHIDSAVTNTLERLNGASGSSRDDALDRWLDRARAILVQHRESIRRLRKIVRPAPPAAGSSNRR